MRRLFEMSEEDLARILEACKPVPCMMIGGMSPPSPQENANASWAELGRRMGFDPFTVQPTGQGDRFFSAVSTEPLRAAVDEVIGSQVIAD